jgi:O-antigen/teichoic acid export membrane protein
MVTKLRIVTSGVMGVLFPAFTEAIFAQNLQARRIYIMSVAAMATILAPPVVLIVVFAEPAIALWLSPEFAKQSFRVAQILAVGVLIHGLGQPAFTLIQAAGKPDWTAKLHMAEIPLYVAYLLPLIYTYGIVGAALAWSLRVAINTSLLTTLVFRLLTGSSVKIATVKE